MIKFKKWPWILVATIVSVALWTVISMHTGLFFSENKSNYFWYIISYASVVGAWALTVLKFNLSDKLYRIISVAASVITPFFCMQISMLLAGEAEFSFGVYFINIMFYIAVMAIVLAITRSLRWSSIVTILISFIFNVAIFVVNIFRGTPLIPIDFLAAGTAVKVLGNYSFQLKYQLIAATVVTIFMITLILKFSFKLKFKFKNIILPLSGCAAALIFMICMSFVDYTEVNMDFFDQYHANNTHGTAYSFYINVRKMMLYKPEGYSESEAQQLLDNANGADGEETEEAVNEVNTDDMPNVIAIMNESFSDLSVVGDFETEEDYLSYFRSMSDNTVKGQLLVSPFGGNTCNTEFEFMTGLSMGLLPSGSTPYLQYVTKKYPLSLPSHFNDLGYETIAVHPYYARCWNRNKVYSLFGFDRFISIDNLSDYIDEDDWQYKRNYLSDNTSYDAVINQLENKEDGKKAFIFNVTMQNHGGYNYDETPFEGLHITNMKGSYPEAEQYLASIRESDKAFERLVNYLKDYDEPTIVLIFGDHQPAIEQEFFEELYGKELDEVELEDLQKRYTIPFAIWANYDIESKSDVRTSPNYLSNLLLDTAGIPKNELGNFTESISESIPQLNVMGHYDADGIWNTNDIASSELLKNYEDVEYYLLTRKEK